MSEKRFSCPDCGQHFAVHAAWCEAAVLCPTCGQTFQPSGLVPPGPEPGCGDAEDAWPDPTTGAVEATPPTPTSQRITVRVVDQTRGPVRVANSLFAHCGAVALGLVTPLLLLAALSAGAMTWIFAIVVAPFLCHFVALKLCEAVFASGGRPAFNRYVVSTLLGFLVWGGLSVVVFFFTWLEGRWPSSREGAGAASFLISLWLLASVGIPGTCWTLAVARCWYAVSERERSSFPSGRVGNRPQIRNL